MDEQRIRYIIETETSELRVWLEELENRVKKLENMELMNLRRGM